MPSDLQTLEQVRAAHLQNRTLAQLIFDRKVWNGKWDWAKKSKAAGTGSDDAVKEARAGLDMLQEAVKTKRKAPLDDADQGSDKMIDLATQMITTAKKQKTDHQRARDVQDRGW